MAKKNCVLCGEEYEEGQHCPNGHLFKKMCLNCTSCLKGKDGAMFCANEENKKSVMAKMEESMKAASSGYEIADFKLDLKPLTLKTPTNKCPRWELNEKIIDMIRQAFQ